MTAIRLAVLAGGVLGTALRAGVAEILPADGWPWATLTVNLVGAFLLGGLLAAAEPSAPIRRAFLGTGLLGSFTTFSAFAVEVTDLAHRPAVAALYAVVSVVGGVALAVAGRGAGRAAVGEGRR